MKFDIELQTSNYRP